MLTVYMYPIRMPLWTSFQFAHVYLLKFIDTTGAILTVGDVVI